jgi:hypothetical protein
MTKRTPARHVGPETQRGEERGWGFKNSDVTCLYIFLYKFWSYLLIWGSVICLLLYRYILMLSGEWIMSLYISCAFVCFNAINIQVYSTVLSRIIESMLNEKDVEEQQSWRTKLISVWVFLLVFFLSFILAHPDIQLLVIISTHLAKSFLTSSPFWSCHAVALM